ncbi:retrovirus-related pol polyprotein from transposon TNT 1-94 [Tanacetum coccineum]|uniref:Retrovirus-related pol polyprotein from transposon TNT 1-94 n=1 Tax=Tanacetum coccineum TaxID=301880 RepID=A0ABQ4XAV3_9ASTR
MSTSTTHQQSLGDAGSDTRPSILERGSYIPWVSRFRRYPNRKRENRKWLNKAIDEGPYEFKEFTPSESEPPRMQKEEDLKGDDLKHYEAEIEEMNLILISIPNDIYNFVDACTIAQAMWQRFERLMRGTVQNKLMNDLERNGIIFPKVSVNTKFLNYLQPEWLKAKEVGIIKCSILRWLAHMGSSSKTTSPYYVTHPSSVVDYDVDYQEDAVQNTFKDPLTSAMILLARAITQHFSNPTNNRLRTSSNTRNQAIVQANKLNIQSRNSGNYGRNIRRSYVQEEVSEGTNVQNDARNTQRTLQTMSSGTAANLQCYNCSEKGHYARNYPKPRVRDSKYFMEHMLLAKQDEAGVILTDEHNDFLFDDASRMEEIKELSSNICLMAIIQPANLILMKEQLARNAFKEAEKQQIIAKKVQQQNTVLTKQLESYKENVWNPKLYDASCLDDLKIQMNVRDTEDIFNDATKSQIKMKKKSQDPIAIGKKQNVWTIDYRKLNALYKDFVPQKEFSAEQKYFSSSFISFENSSNASSPSLSSETKPTVAPMPSANPMKLDLNKMENEF